ncbi:MAG: hypothetical protein ACKV2T_32130 [Kofleriaceae bacterium]
MSLRLSLVLALAAAGCARQAPHVRAPSSTPMFDVSRICSDPTYPSICDEQQAPAALPSEAPIRVDTNLATPPVSTLGFQG